MALYLRLLLASLRARMQYRWDFLLSTLFYGIGTGLELLTVASILYRYPSIGGWNLYEIALLSGVINIAWGLCRVLGSELENFQNYLISGEFDNLLVRPWPSLLILLSRRFDFGRLGSIIQGAVVLALGLTGVLAAGAPLWLIPYSITLLIPGALTVGAIHLLTATAGFWIIRIEELQVFTVNGPISAANYPAHIFPNWMRKMMTSVLPVAGIAYTPLRYALGKGGSPFDLIVPYLGAALSLAISLWLWRIGERHYQSTGS